MVPAGAVRIPIIEHFGASQFIGALKKEKKKNVKEKDNQYKLKRPVVIAIGLIKRLIDR